MTVLVDRLGIADSRRREVVDEVVDAFEVLPPNERQALRSFYVEGFSIREIAARHAVKPGTVKRRLSQGRDRVRGALGLERYSRSIDMTSKINVFPTERPPIAIEPSGSAASNVDMRELTWWFVVPELGDEVHWAEYQPTGGGSAWRLTRTSAMRAHRRATIHGREGIEIEVDEQWLPVNDAPAPPPTERDARVWGRLTDTHVEWLAVESRAPDGAGRLYTCLDDCFDENFGVCQRLIEAGEYLVPQPDGGLERRAGTPEIFADGVFDVAVGESSFRCTRVVEMPAQATEQDVVIVAYVNDAGRTVLFRRYDGDQRTAPGRSGRRSEWLPHAERLTIDGMTFVHSFDDVVRLA